MGNRILEEKKNPGGKVEESNRYVYNESNQLTEAVLCDGRTTRKVCYTYDDDGNLVKEYSPTDNLGSVAKPALDKTAVSMMPWAFLVENAHNAIQALLLPDSLLIVRVVKEQIRYLIIILLQDIFSEMLKDIFLIRQKIELY